MPCGVPLPAAFTEVTRATLNALHPAYGGVVLDGEVGDDRAVELHPLLRDLAATTCRPR